MFALRVLFLKGKFGIKEEFGLINLDLIEKDRKYWKENFDTNALYFTLKEVTSSHALKGRVSHGTN